MIPQTFKKVNVRSFQIMKYFQTPQKVSPGRWTIETCQKKIFTKTDYSNEDHCGICDKKMETYEELYPAQVQEEDDETFKYYLI
jgi:hypothetical protein